VPTGVGRPLAQRLLADGETVVDVPAKLAARVRVFDTGNARKTDASDAHAVAMVAVRTPRLNQLAYDANAADSAEEEAGPGGHSGATPQSSAADLHTPVIGSPDKPQPGPAPSTLPRTGHRSNTHPAPTASPPRRRDRAVNVERPTVRTTLQRGTLTTEGVGVFVPGATSTAAVTGGTGAYEGASGHATFVYNPGAESPITFVLVRR
jgi:hypothetical protein